MSSSFQSSSAAVSDQFHGVQAGSKGPGEFDDVAFGCECADPSLQIDAWGHENTETLQAAGSPA